jgi:hypothetical protein
MDIIKFTETETETETESESECESETINVNMTVLRPTEDGCMVYLTKDNFNISVTENEYGKIFDGIQRDGVVIKDIYDDVMKDCKLNDILQEIERLVKKEYYIIAVKKCNQINTNNYPITKQLERDDYVDDKKMVCYVTFLMPTLVKHEYEDYKIFAFVKQKCIIVMTTSDFIDIENNLLVNKYYNTNTFNPLMRDCPFNDEIESYQYNTNMEYSIIKIEQIDM